MTDKEAQSNAYAERILQELRDAKTPEECASIAQKYNKAFERLQEVNPARAIHIVNLVGVRKREFRDGAQSISERGPRRRMAAHQDKYGDLSD